MAGIFIAGCALKHPKPHINKNPQNFFKGEDSYIIKALFYEQNGEYQKSIPIYKFLYEKTKQPVFYEKIVQDLYQSKKFNKTITTAQKFLKKRFDKKILEYEIFALINLKKYNEAKEILLKKLNKKDTFFYSMMSYIYLMQDNYQEAVYYMKSLYALNPNRQTLLELSDLLIKMHKYNEALAYLRTHLNLYGCDPEICQRLILIYRQLYDLENLAVIYEKMGKYNPRYYLMALNIYMDQKDYKNAKRIILKYGLDREYLMFLYAQMHKYKKAAKVAFELYKKYGDDKFLVKYCEYMYKSNPDKRELKKIVFYLKKLTSKYDSAYLYNFLGYILINYDINPHEGIFYVKKALQLIPDNPEYIDSLAWGYYKIGKCKEAWNIIKNVRINDPEIIKHKKLIKRCLNDIGKNHKQNKRRIGKKKIETKHK
jgi:predicted Zn-dependent protease